jgi:hypothetical protein
VTFPEPNHLEAESQGRVSEGWVLSLGQAVLFLYYPNLWHHFWYLQQAHAHKLLCLQVPLDELHEGSIITGVITDVWLYHGIQVDFGAASDG